MNNDGKRSSRGIRRREFLSACDALSAAALLPGGLAFAAAGADGLRIQRLAWAGIRLQLPQAMLFIDPLVNPDAWGAALEDPLIPVGNAVGDTYVLITHAQLLGDFTATAVPASDGYGDVQVSWVVSAGGRRIFHGGDTLWHGYWWRIGRQFGPFDAAFLPVNGARFGWRKPVSGLPGVLTPEQAVAAATILGARRLVPIHYGVFGMAEYVEVEDPIGRMRKAARENSLGVQPVAPGARGVGGLGTMKQGACKPPTDSASKLLTLSSRPI